MSLLADAESPKVAFENVELKENKENRKILEEDKENPREKCGRLFRENKIILFLICLVILSIVLGIAIGFVIVSARKDPVVSAIPTNYRLPSSLIPQHYVLEVQPYIIPNQLTFDGKVEILVGCVEETDKVILHSNQLTINEEDVRIRNIHSNSIIKVNKVEYNETMSFLILHLSKNMKEYSEYLLFLSFKGKLQRSGKGFYVSNYYDENNEVHYVASTQFEAIHAREGFPCFDEPAFKATFEVTIVRWKNMSSLSNMPRIKTERRGNDWVADTFLTTLKMSTYTLAYYVGEYIGKVENKIRVWAPKHKQNLVDFSLDIANKLLPYFEDKLKYPYTPPKMDMIPVTDLVAGAMENWGLIIYTDNQFYYNPDKKSAQTKELVAATIAHELAHQWFGNLVTPKWWSDIWVSEGMTTYMENIASTHFFPKWNEIDKALISFYDKGIEKDCLDDNPLTVWKNLTADKIKLPMQTFGMMTYIKGAMIGRMMHYILGNKTFWRGIISYLHEYAYKNVEEEDMWRFLTQAQIGKNKLDMANVMWSWTHNSGVPIVTVARDYSGKTATFSQHSCKDRNIPKYSSDLWHVPISYTTNRNHDWNPGIQTWFAEKEITLKDMPSANEWILLNGQSVGCYLVNYDKRNWELLAEQLRKNHEVFSIDQRYKILADANILYKFGNVSVDVVLDVSSYLGKERVLSIYSYPNLKFIDDNIRDMEYSSYDEYWTEFMISVMAPIQYALGWEANVDEELRLTRLLRGKANRMLCELDYLPCVEEAVKRFYAFKYNNTMISGYIKDYLFCAAVRSGPSDITDHFMQELSDDSLDYVVCSKNETVINYIFHIFAKGWKSELYSPVMRIMRNRKYWRIFLDFLDDHLASRDDEVFSWLIAVGRGTSSLEQIEKLREVVKHHIDKVPETETEKERLLNYLRREDDEFEIERKSKVELIGKWLKKRLWKQ